MVALEYLAWHFKVPSFELVTLVPGAELKNNIYLTLIDVEELGPLVIP